MIQKSLNNLSDRCGNLFRSVSASGRCKEIVGTPLANLSEGEIMPTQGQTDANAQTMASAHAHERREARYLVAFPIEVSGIRDGEPFREKTFTQNVSEWGIGFRLSVELKREDLVSVKVLDDTSGESRHSLYQVTRVSQQLGHWVMGAWKLGAEDMWGAELEKLAATEARREFRGDSKARDTKGQSKDGQR